MRIILLFGLLICISSCNFESKTKQIVQLDNSTVKGISAPYFDYIGFDSVLVNCKIKTSINMEELINQLGDPDTIIRYTDTMGFYDEPFSLLKYKDLTFHLFDNGHAQLHKVRLDSYSLCLNNIQLNSSTTLRQISNIFPNSYIHRDTITHGDERLVAVRLNTSNKPTDSQWILLFLNNTLEYFDYFNGDD